MDKISKKQNNSVSSTDFKKEGLSGVASIDSLSLRTLLLREDLQRDVRTASAYRLRRDFLLAERAKEITKERMDSGAERRKIRNLLHHQSKRVEGVMNELDDVPVSMNQNITEMAGEEIVEEDATPQILETSAGVKTQFGLDDFFKRPVILTDQVVTSFLPNVYKFDIWDLWSKNAAVRAKLNNYAFFRGKLKIRIAISATPFHYGKLLFSYQPYPNQNDVLGTYGILFSAPTSNPKYDQVWRVLNTYLSQSPDKCVVDVRSNEPVDLTIPFISYKKQFRLYNQANTVITNADSFSDFAEAGTLYVSPLNFIKQANGNSDPYSFSIYGWVEDIELGVSTATDLNITAQGKMKVVSKNNKKVESEKDEYKSPGPVEVGASAVAGAAAILAEGIPFISPFARGAGAIASAAADVARYFGWSRPVVLDKPMYVKPHAFSNGANMSADDTAIRLTADPKQGLAVGSNYAGSSTDDLAILTIASRESYLTTVSWKDTDTPRDTTIFESSVNPMLFSEITGLPGQSLEGTKLLQFVPCAAAAMPFDYWRGTMRFRFEFVVSQFHRGKMLIRYEPNSSQWSLIKTNPLDLNQQNTIIVDLQEVQDIEIDVEWAHPRDFARVTDQNFKNCCTLTEGDSTVHAANILGECYANGIIQLTPLNALVTPDSTAEVEINVYVSCPDLMLARPSNVNLTAAGGGLITYQSKLSINEKPTSEDFFLDNFGEIVPSLRGLMKRYQTHYVYSFSPTITGSNKIKYTLPIMPSPWLYYSPTATSPPYTNNYSVDLYGFLRMMYLGFRGSIRYRIGFGTTGAADETANYNIYLDAESSNNSAISVVDDISGYHPRDLSGGTLAYWPINGGVEVEIPYYNYNLYSFSFNSAGGAGSTFTDGYDTYTTHNAVVELVANTTTTNPIDLGFDLSFGEDATFMRFQGAPLTFK